MQLLERAEAVAAVTDLLDRGEAGSGGVVVIAGPKGSGRSALADAAVERARTRGFEVLRGTPTTKMAGQWVWAQLLRDAGGAEDVVAQLLADEGPGHGDLDEAAMVLCAGGRRLVVVDDVDAGGPEALAMLAAVAGRAVAAPVAVLVTSREPLGIGAEVWLGALSPTAMGVLTGEKRPEVRYALWLASRGLPGPGRTLAAHIEPSGINDPVVALALGMASGEGFLEVDSGLVGLLELALAGEARDPDRARLMARLARALLGDPVAGGRRRSLIEDALVLARRSRDPAALAEVLDARLHALWDPDGAADRLAASGDIIDLARESAQLERGRRGLFWRFVALMELGRVDEAEASLATFERAARSAGDAEALVMVVSRHAMLATIRGQFEQALALTAQVADQGRRVGMTDAQRLVGTLRGAIALLREDPPDPEADAGLEEIRAFSRRNPGHLYEATAARLLMALGRTREASLELERALPRVLAGSGPRWLGAAADLAVVSVATGNTPASTQLYASLSGHRGRLVAWAGANTVTGPVSHYLGILAAHLGQPEEAVELLMEAVAWEEKAGTLPFLAHTLAALGDTLSQRRQDGDVEAASEHRQRARGIASRLEMSALLGRLAPPTDEWMLLRDGSDWRLEAGDEQVRLRDSRGMAYLAALLAAPGQEIAALDLVAGGAGLSATAAEPVLDQAARDAYRRRLAELDDVLDAADAAGDSTRAKQATSEREALVAELRRASGLGGRDRGLSGADERARVNVTRTLRATLARITEVAPRAGAHLTASIHTGRACRYQPTAGGPSRWCL